VGWRRGLERSERAGERAGEERAGSKQASKHGKGKARQGRAQAVQPTASQQAGKHAVCRRRSRQWRGSGRAGGEGKEDWKVKGMGGRSRGKGKVRASASLAWLS